MAVFVTIQSVVPAYVLVTKDRPAQFGWQMYAAVTPPPRVDIVTERGVERIPVRRVVAALRPDVRYPEVLLSDVTCGNSPEATAVVVRTGDSARRTGRWC